MPRVTNAHRESRRRQILDASIECFAREGFHRTSMAQIIAEAGVSAGTIYLYFTSKEEIVEAIAEERHVLESALASTALANPDTGQALHGLAAGYLDWLSDPLEQKRRRVTVDLRTGAGVGIGAGAASQSAGRRVGRLGRSRLSRRTFVPCQQDDAGLTSSTTSDSTCASTRTGRRYGKVIAEFAAFKNHLSYLPHSGSIFALLRDEVASYKTPKGALRFRGSQHETSWCIHRVRSKSPSLAARSASCNLSFNSPDR
jgi:AcrR family transcriptional regulator